MTASATTIINHSNVPTPIVAIAGVARARCRPRTVVTANNSARIDATIQPCATSG